MTSEASQQPRERRRTSRLWVPAFLATGLVLGASLSYFLPESFRYWDFLPPEFQEAFILHTILSTMSIILLVALALVYLKVYVVTRARFSLGIVIVLFALLFQALFQYPLILNIEGPFPGGQGAFLSYADFFTVAAYTVFLYLSLE